MRKVFEDAATEVRKVMASDKDQATARSLVHGLYNASHRMPGAFANKLAGKVAEALATVRADTLAECKRIANDCLQSHSPVRDGGEIIAHGNPAACIYASIEALETEPSDPTKREGEEGKY